MNRRASTLDEARELGDELEEVYLDKAWEEPWQEVVQAFPNLRRLRICQRKDWDVGPLGVLPKMLTHLEVHYFGKDKNWTELVAGINALPNFESLSVYGAPALSEAIGGITGLKELNLNRVMGELPATLAQCQGLESFSYVVGQAKAFPEVLCELANLRRLRFHASLRDLPDAFARLQNLEVLDFQGAFNSGTMSVYRNPAKTNPLPEVLGKLTKLKELNLDMCGVFERDIEALSGLVNLEKLNLKYASIKDLSALAAFPKLKTLELETCYNVRSLESLAGSPVEELSLQSNHYIKRLDGLDKLERLRVLDISYTKIGLEDVCRFEQIQELRARSNLEAQWRRHNILKTSSLKTRVAALEGPEDNDADQALAWVSIWAKQHSSGERTALYEVFGVSHQRDAMTQHPVLSAAVKRSGGETLAEFVEASLVSISDSLAATAEAVEILVERKDLPAQVRVCKAFTSSLKYYDPGNVGDAPTLQSQLYAMLPNFLPEALAGLLGDIDNTMLETDHLDALFPNALQGASLETKEEVTKRIRKYVKTIPSDRARALIEKVEAVDPKTATECSEALARADRIFELNMRLEDADEDEVLEVLAEYRAGEIPGDELKAVTAALKPAFDTLGPIAAKEVFDISLELEAPKWRGPALVQTLAEHELSWFETIPEAHRPMLSEEVSKMIRARKSSGEGDDETFLELSALLCGTPMAELQLAHVQEEFAAALGKKDPKRLLAALNAFMDSPTQVTVDDRQKIMLSSAYEKLFFQQQWGILAEISDKLLSLSEYLEWSEEARQYPLTYLVAAAISQNSEAFLRKHLDPWLENGLVEPRLAFNLACFWAKAGNYEETLGAVRNAMELGKPASQFAEDTDFAPYIQRPEMLKLLSLSATDAGELAAIDPSEFPSYDLEAMVQTCVSALAAFGNEHQDTTFCAVVVRDTGNIDLNAEGSRGANLDNYSHQGACGVNQGFDMDDAFSFSLSSAYERQGMPFAKAMTALLRRLEEENAYETIQRTEDFVASVWGLQS